MLGFGARDAGLPQGELFAATGFLKKKIPAHSTSSLPESLLEPSQEGLSISKRSTSDRLSLGRFSGCQGHQTPFKIVEPASNEQAPEQH